MNKKYFVSIIAILMANCLVYAENLIASAKDTMPGNTDVLVYGTIMSQYPWLQFDVDVSYKNHASGVTTETRHYHIHNGQFSIQKSYGKSIQNYSFRFTVDTVSKSVAIYERKNVLTAIMFFDFDNKQLWERLIQRMYAVDSGSLRKLVMEFKPESPWEKYSVVYDPVTFFPKQIRYTMKKVNSAGQRVDDEYICDFKNYQTTAFDESVFSNDPYFKRVDGKPVLTETYSNYFLHISERSK